MRTTFLIFLLIGLLTACGVQPGKQQVPEQSSAAANAERIQQLLGQAEASESPLREELQLEAAALLLTEHQPALAEQIIETIQPQSLTSQVFARYGELKARLYIERGLYDEARVVLEDPTLLDGVGYLPTDQQIRINLLRAEVYALLGSHIASAQQRIYLAPLLSGDLQETNRQAIWRSLMYVPIEELTKYRANSFSAEYKGWLDLAFIARENQGDLDQQVSQLDQWQQQWPQHPANQNLPGGLQLIKELAANRPQQVALLLPLTGKLAPFGKAVRDGFIAALYETQRNGGRVPKLIVYNTEDSPVFFDLYQQAVAEGAELIVGPLEKERLRELFQEISLPVPTLALNRGEDFGLQPLNLYQFGLAPQDEAKQVADIAFLQNHRKAMIISPKGEWGDKVSHAFIDRWETLGADVVTQSFYSGQEDYSKSIKEALALQTSEDRAKRIQQLAGEHIEFTPRRREDIDMVFMLARPQQARSIKPLLAYHYAGDLPVYATSRVYAGYKDLKRDRDINGVQFTDMPWVLNEPSTLHRQISSEVRQSQQYQRFYALGIDSFQLHPRLRQLEEIANSRVYGQTGRLKLNHYNAIERELLFAQIKNSQARLIPTVDQSLNPTVSKEGTDNEKRQLQPSS